MRSLLHVLLLAGCSDGALAPVEGTLEVAPARLALGDVPVAFVRARSVALSNFGAAPVAVTASIEGSDELSLSTSELSVRPGSPETIEIRWQPRAIGELAAELVLHTDLTATPELRVPIDGRVIEAAFVLSPDPLDFDRVRTGRTVERTATVTNLIDQPLTLQLSDPRTQSFSGFALESPRTLALPAGGTAAFTVSFTPQALGPARDRIEVTGDCEPSCRGGIALEGQGVESSLICAPVPLELGRANPATCVMRKLTCTNVLDQEVTVGEVFFAPVLDPFSAAAALPATLAQDQSIEIEVSFCPPDLAAYETALHVLSVEPDAGERTVIVPVTGAGGGPDVRVTPASLFAGAALVGEESRRNLLVENVGYDLLHVSAVAIDPPGAPFSVDLDQAFVVAAGGSQVVEVRFRPLAVGSVNATLWVRSDDPDRPEIAVPLSAAGVDAPPCSAMVSPSEIAFGLIEVGARRTRSVTLRATGDTACAYFDPRLESGAVFALDAAPPMGSIAPGEAVSFTVHYAPAIDSPPGGDRDALLFDVPNRSDGDRAIRIPIHGVAAPIDLVAYPNPIDFGVISLDYRRLRALALYNAGTGPHQIVGLDLLPGSSATFTVTTTAALPFTLAPGASLRLDVGYGTSTAGVDAASLAVSSANLPGPLIVDLFGEGRDDPCGHIAGRICAPDGTDSVGALVTAQSADGSLFTTTTDADGRFYLYCVPPGLADVVIERGHFRAAATATVVEHQTAELEADLCLSADGVRIAVVTGFYDTVQNILTDVGLTFDLHDGQGAIPLVLTDAALLFGYDILFLNCGYYDIGVRDPIIAQNLRDFVAAGGSIYASDFAYDAVEIAFPDYVEFFGDDTLQDSAQAGSINLLTGTVLDPAILARLNGLPQVTVTFSGGYALIDGASPATVVHVAGESQGPAAGAKPLLISFEPSAISGKVVYTSFHNSDVILDPGMRVVLELLVFAL